MSIFENFGDLGDSLKNANPKNGWIGDRAVDALPIRQQVRQPEVKRPLNGIGLLCVAVGLLGLGVTMVGALAPESGSTTGSGGQPISGEVSSSGTTLGGSGGEAQTVQGGAPSGGGPEAIQPQLGRSCVYELYRAPDGREGSALSTDDATKDFLEKEGFVKYGAIYCP